MTPAGTARLFEPVQLGPLRLRNRILLPPHGGFIGATFGTEEQARQNDAYWRSRAADGAALVVGLQGFMDNSVLIPGFEPTGQGARVTGVFRMPHFRERAGSYARAIQEGGAYAGIQFLQQGATPHSPSGILANHSNNQVPHVLTRAEIAWFVDEYAFAARESRAAGLDLIELHANHEDLLHLFLSPATNKRTDEYGGDLEGRSRIVREILAAVRAEAGDQMAVGVRLNMDELFDGGYDVDGGIAIARRLEQTGHIDYVHCVIGNNWGAPSYVQAHHYPVAGWAETAGRFRRELAVPVAYTGRITTPRAAAGVIAEGHADLVGLARAMFADAEFVSKAKHGRDREIRPCIGTNDCLHRGVVEGLSFGCSVNPRTGRETEPLPMPASPRRRIVVVGGGPAGMEAAALLAERGHAVTLWEASSDLGGQMQAAARARENDAYHTFIDFQRRRLDSAGVTVRLDTSATVEGLRAAAADVVVVATGAAPRRPALPGFDADHVLEGREVLLGTAVPGARVAVIATEDHMQPLTIAGHLVDLGREVTVFYQSPGIAPLVGKYSIGAPLAKLSAGGADVRVTERVVRVEDGAVVTHNIYAGTERIHPGFDSVVLACGGEARSRLYDELQEAGIESHILGDAYAPRRISFATRQAYALAMML